MKIDEKDIKPLVDAARLAASADDWGFWAELEERMNIREEENKTLVEPRKILHS